MLLGRPLQVLRSISLFVPGELQRQRLVLRRRPVVYASPNNPGALAVAKDIASAMHGHIEVTSDAAEVEGPRVTHFLLYLNDMTYLHAAGKRLADELRRARAVGSTIEVVMVHENDQERGGCEFGILFDGRTPQDLLQGGIYNVRACMLPSPATLAFSLCALGALLRPALLRTQALALALYSGRFWPVSVALVAKAIGATTAGSFSRGSSFTTALAMRSAVNHDSKALSHRQSRLPSAGEFHYSCQDLPVPTVSTLEQEIDALIERTDVSKEELLSALSLRGGEREQIGGEANSSATAGAVEVSILCDASGAPSPQRRA